MTMASWEMGKCACHTSPRWTTAPLTRGRRVAQGASLSAQVTSSRVRFPVEYDLPLAFCLLVYGAMLRSFYHPLGFVAALSERVRT